MQARLSIADPTASSTGLTLRRFLPQSGNPAAWFLAAGLCAATASIAVSEIFLSAALVVRLWNLIRRREKLNLAPVFIPWSIWAAIELIAWLCAPGPRAGFGEVRHILLAAALFLLIPALESVPDRVLVWRGIIAVATISSAALILHFTYQVLFYRGNLPPIVYLRGGGLLHHWMIYGTAEILVFAGLLEVTRFYPAQRWWLIPVWCVNVLAIVLSLTRMLWICCFFLLTLDLIWRRSRWVLALPLVPLALFLLAPAAVRTRIVVSANPEYYSNAERLQMLRVGARMIHDHPFTGVGPGRVEPLYRSYLQPDESAPAYYGHLHNNAMQFAAQSGLPALCAAAVFVAILFRQLWRRYREARSRELIFLCRAGILACTGFLASGFFDYSYGHSIGIILVYFTALAPLVCEQRSNLSGNLRRW
ncbi:MAG TPA: O-antigen ligase family protein [Bryobacteraceae bacterium]|nr:O-antigen ligase family protein [Bryobacteraceae bacterium]